MKNINTRVIYKIKIIVSNIFKRKYGKLENSDNNQKSNRNSTTNIFKQENKTQQMGSVADQIQLKRDLINKLQDRSVGKIQVKAQEKD